MDLFKPTTLFYLFSCILFLSCNLFIEQASPEDFEQTLNTSTVSINQPEVNDILDNILDELNLPNIAPSPSEGNSDIEITFSQNSYTVNVAYEINQNYSDFPLTDDIRAFPPQDTFIYSFTNQDSAQLFYIDPNSGTLRIATLNEPNGLLAIRPCMEYNFNIRATDPSVSTRTATVPISVSFSTDPSWSNDTTCDNNDHSPVFSSPTLTIPISSPTGLQSAQHPSASFYSVYAEDQDQGDTIQYSLSEDDDDASEFQIDSVTGILTYVTAANLIDGAIFSFTVTAEDTEGNQDTQEVSIQVNSLYEPVLDIYVVRGGNTNYIYDCNEEDPCTTETDIRNYIENALSTATTNYNRIDFSNANIVFVAHPTVYTPHIVTTMFDRLINYGSSVITYQSGYTLTPTDAAGITTGDPAFHIEYSSTRIPVILTKGVDVPATTLTTECAYVVSNTRDNVFTVDSAYAGGALIVIGSDSECNLIDDFAHEFGHFMSLPHSFDEASCNTQDQGTTTRIMDYSTGTRTLFDSCEEEIITSFIYSFFFVKTQYERQRLDYSRNLQIQAQRLRFSFGITKTFNPAQISATYIGITNNTSKKKYIEYTKTKQQTCYNLFGNYDYCY